MRVEQVEILRLRAAPSVAQVPDQRVGVLERARRRSGPRARPDTGGRRRTTRARSRCGRSAPAEMMRALALRPCRNIAPGWRSAGVTAIVIGAPSRVRRIDSGDRRPDLAAERSDGPERPVVGRQNLVAEQKAGLMRRGALDHAGDERPALIVGLGEDADRRDSSPRRSERHASALLDAEGRRRKCRRAGNRPARPACNSACGRRRASPSIALTAAASSSRERAASACGR